MIDFREKPPGLDKGIYTMSFEVYSSIPALNHSKLKVMDRSPLHFKTMLETPRKSPSPQLQRAFDKGKAFDIFMLEGGMPALRNKVSIEPAINRSTKAYQVWKNNIPEDNLILTENEYRNIFLMAEATWRKKMFQQLFEKGHPHRVLIWREPSFGIWCKAEVDWITDKGTVVDLKTTADASFYSFYNSARRYKYFNQGAFYLRGLTCATGFKHEDFFLAAIETEPPFESHVFKPSIQQMNTAADENKNYIQKIAYCLQTGSWPGYLDQILCLDSGQYFEETGETPDDFRF